MGVCLWREKWDESEQPRLEAGAGGRSGSDAVLARDESPEILSGTPGTRRVRYQKADAENTLRRTR